jgi:predicted nucleic acid-binding protein
MSPSFVIDASVILAWNDPRETNVYADNILDCFETETAITSPLCCLEVNNVLRQFEKKKLITGLTLDKTIAFIECLPILRDETAARFSMPLVIRLSREYDLTIYDACYLELAVRLNLPLASLDNDLLKAAKASGIKKKSFQAD